MGGLRTGIRPVHIASASKMVTDFSGMPIQPHKVSNLLLQPAVFLVACKLNPWHGSQICEQAKSVICSVLP